MYYQRSFLEQAWHDYLAESGLAEELVDPDAFVRWTYARALEHRQPRYAALARNWGTRVSASDAWQGPRCRGFHCAGRAMRLRTAAELSIQNGPPSRTP